MGIKVEERDGSARFEAVVLPHLDAAYSLARWLTRDDHAAEDVVQDAYLRALKFFGSFRGGDGKAWILAIVRNACFDWLKLRRTEDLLAPFDEDIHSPDTNRPAAHAGNPAGNPETSAARTAAAERIGDAVESLPAEYREALVLRELEGLSYKEIASIAEVPIGTVMSRLARARRQLRKKLHLEREEA
jgi:RNA polymerase sigma factor (sigma-70 family)